MSSSEINSDNIEDVYNTLIKSTEEVALATLPKKERKTKEKPSNSSSVNEARIQTNNCVFKLPSFTIESS